MVALGAAALGALVGGCQNEIWLSAPDGGSDLDAASPPNDAFVVDARTIDARAIDAHTVDAVAIDAPIAEDSGVPHRACELVPVTVTTAGITASDEAPTFATSGRHDTLRYGVLVPPAASVAPTEDTHLSILDGEGALREERTFHLVDASGSVTSRATLHSLAEDAPDQGFLLLTPTALQLLDASGDAPSSLVPLAVPPSPVWQRAAGWIDADRFAFVSDTPDLRIAVFDRTSGVVSATSISVASAAAVVLAPGGVTVSLAAPESTVVVYDPDLSGTETLRAPWVDESALGDRLLGAGLVGGERTWLVHNPCEFRTYVTSYRIAADGMATDGPRMQLLCPLVATREGPFVAIASENQRLALYDFATHAFATVTGTFAEPPTVESERDGASVAVLARVPAAEGAVSLVLWCGQHG